jgi:putrescine aminotransferase
MGSNRIAFSVICAAVKLVPDKPLRNFFRHQTNAARAAGITHLRTVVMRAIGDRMVIAPPLVASESEIDEIVAKARSIASPRIWVNFKGGVL